MNALTQFEGHGTGQQHTRCEYLQALALVHVSETVTVCAKQYVDVGRRNTLLI
jgi:hypothetical protein